MNYLSEKKEQYVWDIKHEIFADFFYIGYKRGSFVFGFGQTLESPVKLTTRIWTDVEGAKSLCDLLTAFIKKHDEQYKNK